ncbi:GNAT family N-acetyltransferase [Candidatus Bathyarchaeota archaeon]|nr:GNAT family N-acetyltransferase [Candidatus Bathyarchaeota archaeon]
MEFPGLESIPDPSYPHRKYRGRGIGSKKVKYFLTYLKENGIEEICGELSDRDDYEKATNFWKKQGFTILPYPEEIGTSLAKIHINL